MYVEHGHANGEAGNLGLAAGAGFAIYQRNVGGSATHVERNDSVEAAATRQGSGAYHAARRPGEHGTHRLASRRTRAVMPPLDCMTKMRDRARRSRFSR